MKEKLMIFENIRDQYVMEALESRKAAGRPRKLALVAAVVALTCALMGCAVVYAQSMGWFEGFFAQRGDGPLTPEQIQEIEDKSLEIGETITQNGWTVELDSVLTDGQIGYVLFRVTAPEEIDLGGKWVTVNDYRLEPYVDGELEFNVIGSYGLSWLEDGDGAPNTGNLVLEIFPIQSYEEPFGEKISWYIRLEDFIQREENEAYRQELMNGKHKGQEDVVFTEEEMANLMIEETLGKGVWEFEVRFAAAIEDSDWVELLDEPIKITARKFYLQGVDVPEEYIQDDLVNLYSVRLSALSLTFFFDEGGAAMIHASLDRVKIVMKDGSVMETGIVTSRAGYTVIEALTPIVLEEVDHILLEDGTVIPMPE